MPAARSAAATVSFLFATMTFSLKKNETGSKRVGERDYKHETEEQDRRRDLSLFDWLFFYFRSE